MNADTRTVQGNLFETCKRLCAARRSLVSKCASISKAGEIISVQLGVILRGISHRLRTTAVYCEYIVTRRTQLQTRSAVGCPPNHPKYAIWDTAGPACGQAMPRPLLTAVGYAWYNCSKPPINSAGGISKPTVKIDQPYVVQKDPSGERIHLSNPSGESALQCNVAGGPGDGPKIAVGQAVGVDEGK